MTPGRIMIMFGAFCALFMAAIPNIVWLLCWIVSLITKGHLKYAPFGWTAFGLAAIVIIALAYGFYIGRWRLTVKDIDYANKDIPAAFDGFRIVHISDLHLSTFDDRPDQLERFVSEINKQEADVICFTGDLVTMGKEEAEPYAEILKTLKAKHGVVSVLGNHDFLIYNTRYKSIREREAAVDSLAAFERNVLEWALLRDSAKVITAADSTKITILGVDNRNCSGQGFQTIDRGNLPKAMAGTDGFRILLSHDPSHWDAEVTSTDIQLTLSGHTHAAQISLFGWNPASLMFKESYGMYHDGEHSIYVTSGLGDTAPFRIGARPEITVITLKSK